MGIDTDIEKGYGDIRQFANDNSDTLMQLQQMLYDPPNVRMANGITNRKQQIMTWRLPNGSSVQMYINPENFVVNESKQITQTRTKGGFVVQYWGDNLAKLSLSGTTGSSGVKGVQVLRDIYRAENHAFELVAATQLEELIDIANDTSVKDSNIARSVFNSAQTIRERTFILRPTLASLALSVMLFYQGIQYRGFFTEFSVTESTAPLGLFTYNMSFMVTEIRGSRKNFLPWHKEPLGDSLYGQVVSGTINAVGNSLRSLAGLPQQSQNPENFHPEDAPLSFGDNSLGI